MLSDDELDKYLTPMVVSFAQEVIAYVEGKTKQEFVDTDPLVKAIIELIHQDREATANKIEKILEVPNGKKE